MIFMRLIVVLLAAAAWGQVKTSTQLGKCADIRAQYVRENSGNPNLRVVNPPVEKSKDGLVDIYAAAYRPLIIVGMGKLSGVKTTITFKPVPVKDPSPEMQRALKNMTEKQRGEALKTYFDSNAKCVLTTKTTAE